MYLITSILIKTNLVFTVFVFFLYYLLYYIGFRNNQFYVVYINIAFLKTDVNIDKINVNSFNIDFLTNIESKKQPMLKAYFSSSAWVSY